MHDFGETYEYLHIKLALIATFATTFVSFVSKAATFSTCLMQNMTLPRMLNTFNDNLCQPLAKILYPKT